jgi:sugar O-acyltransferase (sialic acid O-acetyltransferase NeuD family)
VSGRADIILVGYSGHGLVVADAAVCSGTAIRYYADIKAAEMNPFDLEYLGNEGRSDFQGWGNNFLFALGIGDNNVRQRIALGIKKKEETFINIIHPESSISGTAKLGLGLFISKNVSINVLAEVGDYSILNTGCIIEHECSLRSAVHVGPGAVLAGNVTVGDRSFIGANSVIKQGIVIGNDVVIGAGSVVIHDIPDNGKVAGNPARNIR